MYMQNLPISDFNYDHGQYKEIHRQEKSLGLLTQKFVDLLREVPDGSLDLKIVSYNYLDC